MFGFLGLGKVNLSYRTSDYGIFHVDFKSAGSELLEVVVFLNLRVVLMRFFVYDVVFLQLHSFFLFGHEFAEFVGVLLPCFAFGFRVSFFSEFFGTLLLFFEVHLLFGKSTMLFGVKLFSFGLENFFASIFVLFKGIASELTAATLWALK